MVILLKQILVAEEAGSCIAENKSQTLTMLARNLGEEIIALP